jgi:hypothetical protein
MSDNSSKPAIPAWQRAQQPLQPSSDTPAARDVDAKDNDIASQEEPTLTDEAQESHSNQTSTEDVSLSTEERAQQLEIVQSFLQDPGVKDEPIDKKREFLEAKGIAQDMIEQELGTSTATPQALPNPHRLKVHLLQEYKQLRHPSSPTQNSSKMLENRRP